MSRITKGSWTIDELRQVIFSWPSDVEMLDPISEKVQRALNTTLPPDLYPFALEVISTKDGFISKRLALALIDFLVIDREKWVVDKDKITSLRRARVADFITKVKEASRVFPVDSMGDAAAIMNLAVQHNFWSLNKKEFSEVVMYMAQKGQMAIFQVVDGLNCLTRQGFDVVGAVGSVLYWRVHTDPEFKPKQLDLM